MATKFADILFIAIAVAIVVAQLFILRSTARGMRFAGAATRLPARPALEWAYAIVPALALAALLLFSWRAMHPEVVHVEGVAPAVGLDS